MSNEYSDFSQHPTSVNEHRASKTKGGAGLWTAREALVSCLRAIDRGEIEPDQIAIIVTEVEGDQTNMHYWQRCDSTMALLGLYATASADTLKRGG